MGIYAILGLILNIVQVFGALALNFASVKYISQYMAENKPEKARSVVARILQINLITSGSVFGAIFILAPWLSSWLLTTPTHAMLFQALALASVLNVLHLVVSSFLQGLQRLRDTAVIAFLYTMTQNFLGIYLVLMGWGLFGIVIGWISGLLLSSFIGLLLTNKFLGVSTKLHSVKPLIKFSLPLYLSSILGFILSWIDQMFIYVYINATLGLIEAEHILGIYHIAVRASVVPSLISTSIFAALFPQVSELYAQGGTAALKGAFRTSTRYAALVGFPAIIGLAALAYPCMILFAGWKYAQAAWPLTILCISTLPPTLGVACRSIFWAQGRTVTASLITVVHIVSETVGLYVFIAYLNIGMSGAAWAKVLGSVATVMLAVFMLRKNPGIVFDKDALWKSLVGSFLMVLAVVFLDILRQYVTYKVVLLNRFFIFSIRFLPIYIIVGAIAYFFSLVALRAIKKQDIELIHDYLPKGLKQVAKLLSRLPLAE
jgi:O-antigen/teichoic acid export membrane protein